MFTINIKGKQNPKTPEQVKLEIVLFKTGYARVTKIIAIAGSFKDWDSKRQQFLSRGIEATERNKRLLELKAKYLKVAEEWVAEGKDWAPVQWSHCFDTMLTSQRKQKPKVQSVGYAIEEIISYNFAKERIKNGNVVTSFNNAKGYKDLNRRLNEFTKEKYNRSLNRISFNEVNEDFVHNFALFLQKRDIERGNAGGLSTRLRKMYGLCYFASKMNIPDIDLTVFEDVRVLMKDKEHKPKTLSRTVMAKVKNIDRSLLTRVEKFYLDLFLFSYYTGGMASVDVCFLTWDCIDKDGYLCYERVKFPKKARMKFNENAMAIVETYKEKCYGNYVLPIFNARHATEKQRRWRVRKVCKQVNLVLCKVQKLIKYKEKITWYTARGTFISMMIADGFLPIDVAGMSGNSPNTIYRHYYNIMDQKQLDAKLDKTLGSL